MSTAKAKRIPKSSEDESKFADDLAALRALRESGGRLEDYFTVHHVRFNLDPRAYKSEEIKRVRDKLRISQTLFAQLLGVDPKTVRSWEQGSRKPSRMACRFIEEIEAAPKHWRGRLDQVFVVKKSKPRANQDGQSRG
jgi:DNA-binding transcriptional regulator YiaG